VRVLDGDATKVKRCTNLRYSAYLRRRGYAHQTRRLPAQAYCRRCVALDSGNGAHKDSARNRSEAFVDGCWLLRDEKGWSEVDCSVQRETDRAILDGA